MNAELLFIITEFTNSAMEKKILEDNNLYMVMFPSGEQKPQDSRWQLM